MAKLVLVTGGARSGKSSFAERLALSSGGRVVYMATAAALDEEMRQRIESHRRRRPSDWITVEERTAVARALLKHGSSADVVIIDCLAVLVSNLMGCERSEEPSTTDAEGVFSEIDGVLEAVRRISAKVIVVTNEVGLGIVPANPLARLYRDALGRVNQLVAYQADQVYLMVSGIPVELKSLSASRRWEEHKTLP